MIWRQDLQETIPMGDGGVKFRVFAKEFDMRLTVDNGGSYRRPTLSKEGCEGWEIETKGEGLWMNILLGGYLKNPFFENEEKIIDKVIEKRVDLTQNSDWLKGQKKGSYNTFYRDYVNEVSGGESIFDFKGQEVIYPDFDTTTQTCTNEMVVMRFATHSIVNFKGTGVLSQIEYWLNDESGKEVLHVKDTRGGWHPCTNSPDCSAKLRGNNHPDDSARWLRLGKYKLTVKNLSDNKDAVQKIQVVNNNYKDIFVEENLNAGDTRVFVFNLTRVGDYDSYKINCNVW